MSNRILVPVVMVLVGAIAWLCLDRGPRPLQADTALQADTVRAARSGLGAAMAGQVAPAAQFRIKTVTTGNSWVAFRYNVSTGETSQTISFKFQKVTEPGTIPNGDYDLEAAPLGPNGYVGYALVRIDRVSGRSWFLQGNAWVEIQ
jgi:hypothetical protein